MPMIEVPDIAHIMKSMMCAAPASLHERERRSQESGKEKQPRQGFSSPVIAFVARQSAKERNGWREDT
jgi:hypothetical protein